MKDKIVTVIPVTGMTCQNCVNKIESAVARFSSVVLVKVECLSFCFCQIILLRHCMFNLFSRS